MVGRTSVQQGKESHFGAVFAVGVVSVLMWALCATTVAFAQAPALPCGDIIKPQNPFDHYSGLVTTAIQDCGDPFLVTTDPASPYTLSIDGNPISNGDTVQVAEGGTSDLAIAGTPSLTSYHVLYFLHDGDDYRFVPTDAPSTPTEGEYRTLAGQFFSEGTDIEPYIAAVLSEDYSMPDEDQQNLLYSFLDYVDANFAPEKPKLQSGTYTLLITEDLLILSQRSMFETLFAYVIPTAHAQTFPEYRYTITFTLTETPPEPEGASSVLFLPGIQASRLYKDGLLGTEDQVWEPSANFGNDLHDLAMTPNGASVEDVYTRDVIDSVTGVGNIYSGFLGFLNQQKTAAVPLKDFTAFAYDWRFSPLSVAEEGTQYEDGMRSLVSETEELAEDSYTEKVTIIAHSNGGLVAKALVNKLEELGKANLVDRVIFIGTPQLGTPKAIATILHGYDQTDSLGGIVTNGRDAREVANNMPGVYTLLPSEKYFEGLSEPIISFEQSTNTVPYRAIYGNTIDSFSEYLKFLKGAEGEARTVSGPLATPATANVAMLNEAVENHQDIFDNWIAPAGIDVVEIVGTGLPTVKAIEYRTIAEGEDCEFVFGFPPRVCRPIYHLKAYAHFTKYGDETVVQSSANAHLNEDEIYYLDIPSIQRNETRDIVFAHYNLAETMQTQKLVRNIISGSTTSEIAFVSQNPYTFDDLYNLEIIDSPVRMLAEDSGGNQTGIVIADNKETIVEDIPGSQYFEIGETKYLVLPKDTDHTTRLFGEAAGNYALAIASLNANDTQTIAHRFENASVTPRMTAKFSQQNGVYSPVETDLNGDGIVDLEVTVDGIPVVYTYTDLKNALRSLSLARTQEKLLLASVALAEEAGKKKKKQPSLAVAERALLAHVSNTLELYKKKGSVSQSQLQKIQRIINSII